MPLPSRNDTHLRIARLAAAIPSYLMCLSCAEPDRNPQPVVQYSPACSQQNVVGHISPHAQAVATCFAFGSTSAVPLPTQGRPGDNREERLFFRWLWSRTRGDGTDNTKYWPRVVLIDVLAGIGTLATLACDRCCPLMQRESGSMFHIARHLSGGNQRNRQVFRILRYSPRARRRLP